MLGRTVCKTEYTVHSIPTLHLLHIQLNVWIVNISLPLTSSLQTNWYLSWNPWDPAAKSRRASGDPLTSSYHLFIVSYNLFPPRRLPPSLRPGRKDFRKEFSYLPKQPPTHFSSQTQCFLKLLFIRKNWERETCSSMLPLIWSWFCYNWMYLF